MAPMTPTEIASYLGKARETIMEAAAELGGIHHILTDDGQEGGLEHVQRQLQNADIICMFMQRTWAAIANQKRAGG